MSRDAQRNGEDRVRRLKAEIFALTPPGIKRAYTDYYNYKTVAPSLIDPACCGSEVVIANRTWVVTGDGDVSGNNLWYSTDNGITWKSESAFGGGDGGYTVYVNGTWVVSGEDSTD